MIRSLVWPWTWRWPKHKPTLVSGRSGRLSVRGGECGVGIKGEWKGQLESMHRHLCCVYCAVMMEELHKTAFRDQLSNSIFCSSHNLATLTYEDVSYTHTLCSAVELSVCDLTS